MNKTTPIFICDLDRYGRIGHQTSRMLTAFLFAHLTGGKFIPQDYKFFPYRANEIFDFKKSNKAITKNFIVRNIITLSNGYREPYGNDCFDFSSPEGIKLAYDIINEATTSSDNETSVEAYTIVKLPFDQPPGLLVNLLKKSEIYDDFRRAFTQIAGIDRKFDLVIHIRRGDVTKASHPDWWIGDDIYIDIINELFHNKSCLPNVCVCTQKGASANLLRHMQQMSEIFPGHLTIRASDEGWSNNDEIEDFCLMTNSNILIGGQSSFPCLAALASQNTFIFMGNKSNIEYPFGLQPELIFCVEEYKNSKSLAKDFTQKIHGLL